MENDNAVDMFIIEIYLGFTKFFDEDTPGRHIPIYFVGVLCCVAVCFHFLLMVCLDSNGKIMNFLFYYLKFVSS